MSALDILSQSERNRVRITGVKAMQLRDQGGQSLVKVGTDAGIYGLGEAGAAGPTARAHLRQLEPLLIGEEHDDVRRLP